MNPFKYLIMIPFGWLLLQLYRATGNYGIALILFSTWFQGWLVGIIAKINWAWIQPLARTIAGLAAGFVQMVVLFPMEKFVLLKEKKKDGEEAAAEAAAE